MSIPGLFRSGLSIGQETTNLFHIAGFNELSLSQSAFALGGLLRQDMTVVRFTKLIFTAAGSLEPFCSGAIGLDLGHCLFSFYLFLRPGHLQHDSMLSAYSQNKTDGVSANELFQLTPLKWYVASRLVEPCLVI